jgi:NAD(P)-dependent dehydrogenase (short-subunit alcohol dehydrogenase family)
VDLHLSERRALVTGSAAGIEAAIARQLASEGVAVVVHGRDEQRGQRLAAELTGAGRRAIFIGADLRARSTSLDSHLNACGAWLHRSGGRWESHLGGLKPTI